MKFPSSLCFLLLGAALCLSSCITNGDDEPAPPESEKISSMPHNIPQSWEGSAGMPGMGTGGGY